MGGRTKYIVNGHNAQQQTVQNLFQSVQLNINNPHFLIMQGRITKVLNMKPAEILAMIEEAAGTKMFEDRKAKAFATMAKKEKKVDEINNVSSIVYITYPISFVRWISGQSFTNFVLFMDRSFKRKLCQN
jgi:chromosome segregation ATPase